MVSAAAVAVAILENKILLLTVAHTQAGQAVLQVVVVFMLTHQHTMAQVLLLTQAAAVVVAGLSPLQQTELLLAKVAQVAQATA
jgi:hypothetical protein